MNVKSRSSVLGDTSAAPTISWLATSNLSAIHPQTLAVPRWRRRVPFTDQGACGNGEGQMDDCGPVPLLSTFVIATERCRKFPGEPGSPRGCRNTAEHSAKNFPRLFSGCRGPIWRRFAASEFRSGHGHGTQHHKHKVREGAWTSDDSFQDDRDGQAHTDG